MTSSSSTTTTLVLWIDFKLDDPQKSQINMAECTLGKKGDWHALYRVVGALLDFKYLSGWFNLVTLTPLDIEMFGYI